MPKRTDIKGILILGAGPIVIGQACELDCSDAQMCKALREENYRIVLVNSNSTTTMIDPGMADATYIEPTHQEVARKITEKECPDTVLPTMGGQTALSYALELEHQDVLEESSTTIISATTDTIDKAGDRRHFDVAMRKVGPETVRSGVAHLMGEALTVAAEVGFPHIIHPSSTMDGSGDGIIYSREEFEEIYVRGLDFSSTKELLTDESLTDWKEYGIEMVRDKDDNCVIVCSIESSDAMGTRTGDSITVVPAQTLADREYQIMCSASMMVLRETGIKTGGPNVQFVVDPKNDRLVTIEINPRMSRSLTLASEATNFPVVKVAAKLAMGYILNELMNDITGGRTPTFFEPSIDYVVTKIPRFNFEKFVDANDRLTIQMKSVGEAVAIGRTQQESLQKTLHGLEVDATGFNPRASLDDPETLTKIRRKLKDAGAERIRYITDAFHAGLPVDSVFNLTNIDHWLLVQTRELVRLGEKIAEVGITGLHAGFLHRLEHKGFVDARLAKLAGVHGAEIRKLCDQYDLHPIYKHVDTYAAGFTTDTAYMYSTYEEGCEANPPTGREKIMVFNGGPNRTGQDIEFDHCRVHTSLALRKDGCETVMINYNPEAVSTSCDTSDRLCFEPATLEDILEIVRTGRPRGVIVQYSGQTPLKLACTLETASVLVIGTSPDAIGRMEDRGRLQHVVERLKLKQPANATITTAEMMVEKAKEIGYLPVVRPSYVLDGRAMGIIYDEADLYRYPQTVVSVSGDAPVLLDHFLDSTIEVGVDVTCNDEVVLVGGIMEHIEQAGVHSGNPMCSPPAYALSRGIRDMMCRQVQKLAFELQARGLIDVQLAVKNNKAYLVEVNPCAARTVPFVSEATGIPLVKTMARMIAGKSPAEQSVTKEVIPPYYSVRKVALPFNKFPDVDPLLGLEIHSTGEVVGMGRAFAEAFTKTQPGSNSTTKKHGRALLSVHEGGEERVMDLAAKLLRQGFEPSTTHDMTIVPDEADINPRLVNEVYEDCSHIQNRIKDDEYTYVANATPGRRATGDPCTICRGTLQYKVHYNITLNGGFTTAMALNVDATEKVTSVQEIHMQIK